MEKPTFDRLRPLSWSALSSFEWDAEQWYQKYVIHGKCMRGNEAQGILPFCTVSGLANDHTCPAIETSIEMTFGKLVGERLASDPTYLPHVPRLSTFEYKLECKFGKIPLVGFLDSYEPHTELLEFKTGKAVWTQARADGTDAKKWGQLQMYLLMIFLIEKIRPEDIKCRVFWLPTEDRNDFSIGFVNENDAKVFETKRTMQDILEFGARINRTYKQMQEYCANHE